MPTSLRVPAFAVVSLLVAAGHVLAQAMPSAQPKYLTIYRETVKHGHDAAHAKSEAAWPAAFEKAKSTSTYLALASMTGISEVSFVEPFDSYAALGKFRDGVDANADLSAELQRALAADAEHVDGVRTLEAMAMPDLSHGSYPDMNKQRYWEIAVYRVRPGFEPMFAEVAKMYKGLAARAMPNAAWRVYSVTGGMLAPAFLVFSSTANYAGFDMAIAEGMAGEGKMTPEEAALWLKFAREGVISIESNKYRLDPGMSYVSAETKASDPKFWMKK